MSYPILYSATETQFDHNGLGILGDCAGYRVVTEGNGPYDLTMLYPMDGIHFDEITDRSIIKGKFDKFIEPQLFRVKTISKSMSGNATVYAEHISYDLSGIPVSPFEASDASSALAGLKENAATECPFDFWTDKETQASFKVSVPASIRSRLGGVQGSILDVYGGEYEFDNYTVKLHNNRGMNRGVSIRYGKNLTDIQQDQNCSNVATGVYPYWYGIVDEIDVLVELPEKIVNSPGTYNFVKIRTLDLSAEFETQPTVEQLRAKAENYVEANNIGIPDVSLTVSFVQLAQYAEYKNLELLERISLFDTVNVEFPALGVSATAKVVKIVYDGLANRIESITLGSVRANIADTIANQAQTTKDLFKMVRAPQVAPVSDTDWITNGRGYMVAVRDDAGNWMELCSLDEPDINTAQNVWRWNNGGFGFSSNGYGGPYTLAITQDGHIVADFVTAGTLLSHDGKIGFNLTDGVFFMRDVDVNGKECKFRLDSGGFWVMGEDSANFSLLADSLSTVLRTFTTPMKIYSDVSIDIQAPSVTINGKSY